ncbi:MAG: hypothetical protein M3326_06295, partial [Actinomycetota bacterium]|nr:hypothetical protein [Actinomycetota bacterium]
MFALLAAASAGAASGDVVEVNLRVVGRAGAEAGAYDDVAVAGSTAFVAAGGCPGGTVKVVDVKDARRPA